MGIASVGHLGIDLDGIAAAGQGVGFDQFQTANIGGFKIKHQFVFSLFQGAFPCEFHGGFVRCKRAADQTCLSDVNASLAFVQQNKGFFAVNQVAKLQELGEQKRTAFCVKSEL